MVWAEQTRFWPSTCPAEQIQAEGGRNQLTSEPQEVINGPQQLHGHVVVNQRVLQHARLQAQVPHVLPHPALGALLVVSVSKAGPARRLVQTAAERSGECKYTERLRVFLSGRSWEQEGGGGGISTGCEDVSSYDIRGGASQGYMKFELSGVVLLFWSKSKTNWIRKWNQMRTESGFLKNRGSVQLSWSPRPVNRNPVTKHCQRLLGFHFNFAKTT